MIYKLNREERKLLVELMNYEISVGVYNTYIKRIKNNKFETCETCKKKMIRNIILGVRKPSDTYRNTMTSQYGNLVITYNTYKKEITFIENRVGVFKYEIDLKKKEYLNKKLGIVKTNKGLTKAFKFSGLFGKKVVG